MMWSKKKQGSDGGNLGEVKEITHNYVITEKGIVDKDRFHIPKESIRHVDGQYVWFKITEEQAKQYKRDWFTTITYKNKIIFYFIDILINNQSITLVVLS